VLRDHYQLAPQGHDTSLLEELLSDAVPQVSLFVPFATPSYAELIGYGVDPRR
jgi:hypothetical protein